MQEDHGIIEPLIKNGRVVAGHKDSGYEFMANTLDSALVVLNTKLFSAFLEREGKATYWRLALGANRLLSSTEHPLLSELDRLSAEYDIRVADTKAYQMYDYLSWKEMGKVPVNLILIGIMHG